MHHGWVPDKKKCVSGSTKIVRAVSSDPLPVQTAPRQSIGWLYKKPWTPESFVSMLCSSSNTSPIKTYEILKNLVAQLGGVGTTSTSHKSAIQGRAVAAFCFCQMDEMNFWATEGRSICPSLGWRAVTRDEEAVCRNASVPHSIYSTHRHLRVIRNGKKTQWLCVAGRSTEGKQLPLTSVVRPSCRWILRKWETDEGRDFNVVAINSNGF